MSKIKDVFKYNIPKKCTNLLDFEAIEKCPQCPNLNICKMLVDYEIEQKYGKNHWSISDNN